MNIVNIKKGLCDMCEFTNYKNNKGKEQMVITYDDGKQYCKFHYEVIKEFREQTKGLTKEQILNALIKQGEALKRKTEYET